MVAVKTRKTGSGLLDAGLMRREPHSIHSCVLIWLPSTSAAWRMMRAAVNKGFAAMNTAPGAVFALNQEMCAGHGRCYGLAPEAFDCDDSGYAFVLEGGGSEMTSTQRDRVIAACPEQAITIAETKEG